MRTSLGGSGWARTARLCPARASALHRRWTSQGKSESLVEESTTQLSASANLSQASYGAT
eukprot:3919396-Pyramimonas_sp.AAC.1